MSQQRDVDDPEQELSFELDLDEPCEKVWRALTRPELLATWLMANDFQPEPGRRFNFRGEGKGGDPDRVDCQVLDLDPLRRISYSWRESKDRTPSVVTFVLTPKIHGGTRLRLIHRVRAQSAISGGGFRCAA